MLKLELEEAAQILINAAGAKQDFVAALEKLKTLSVSDLIVSLIKALSLEPKAMLLRLKLAELFLEINCNAFAIEQLKLLRSQSSSPSLQRLMEKLGVQANANSLLQAADSGEVSGPSGQTLASLDFDIELLEDDKP